MTRKSKDPPKIDPKISEHLYTSAVDLRELQPVINIIHRSFVNDYRVRRVVKTINEALDEVHDPTMRSSIVTTALALGFLAGTKYAAEAVSGDLLAILERFVTTDSKKPS